MVDGEPITEGQSTIEYWQGRDLPQTFPTKTPLRRPKRERIAVRHEPYPEKPDLVAGLMRTRTETTVLGCPVAISVLEFPGEKATSFIRASSPTTFEQMTYRAEGEITSSSQAAQVLAMDEMAGRMRAFLQRSREGAHPRVETVPLADGAPAGIIYQQANRHWPEKTGHPQEDDAEVHVEDGLVIAAITDGITSLWGQHPELRRRLGKANPPLAIAQKTVEQLKEKLKPYKHGQTPLTEEKLRDTINDVNTEVRLSARGQLRDFAQTEQGPIPMTAGTTLAAVAYFEGVGLAIIRVGDPVIQFGPEVNLGIREEPTQRPKHLGSTQTIEDGKATYLEYNQLQSDIIIIPEEKLTGPYQDVILFIGSDATAGFVTSLGADRSALYYSDEKTRREILQLAQEQSPESGDDFSFILTSVGNLMKLATQAQASSARDRT